MHAENCATEHALSCSTSLPSWVSRQLPSPLGYLRYTKQLSLDRRSTFVSTELKTDGHSQLALFSAPCSEAQVIREVAKDVLETGILKA